MKKDTCLITGASGFIGRNLCRLFERKGRSFRPAVRSRDKAPRDAVVVPSINGHTDWSAHLHDIGVVIHLAARVHVIRQPAAHSLAAFRKVNVDGTLHLARQAAASGVKRFVFLSSIKVHGEQTTDSPFSPADVPFPADPYAVSKLEAERGLNAIAHETGLEVVIIRPPLVYGREAGGNFARLRKLAGSRWPLPLGGIRNRRSLIGIENLCSCIEVCVEHPRAVKEVLLVSDNHDISTPDLIRMMASSSGHEILLFSVPDGVLKLLARLCGYGAEIRRLTENLQVDCSRTMELLQWQPHVSIEEGIRRCVT